MASAEAGADGHLSKPIAAAKLVEAVRNAVESARDEPLMITNPPAAVRTQG